MKEKLDELCQCFNHICECSGKYECHECYFPFAAESRDEAIKLAIRKVIRDLELKLENYSK